MPGLSKENKERIAVYKRLEIFEGKTQTEIIQIIQSIPFEDREQIKADADKIDFYSPASLYDVVPLVKIAMLVAPRCCPDCLMEWSNHHPLCPRVGQSVSSLK